MISLKDVDKENYIDCIRLSVYPGQENNLASNAITIAQSKFEHHHRVKAIYEDAEVIGLLSFCHEDEPEDLSLYWLFRFMIAKEHQGKGYGTAALELLQKEVRGLGGTRLLTMHKPGNDQASHVYTMQGFKQIGTMDDGDTLLELTLR